MTRRKRWFYYSIAILAGLSLAYIAFVLFFLDFVVDIWWFHALDYGIYFWMRLLYRFVIFIVATLIFSGIFFMNFWVGARYLGKTDIPSHPHEPKKFRRTYKQLIHMFRTGSMVIYTPLSLILGLTVSLPFFSRWHQALLWVLGPDAGQTDPVYGLDISYFLFSYPIYVFLQNRLLVTFIVLLVAMTVLYWFETRLLSEDHKHMPRGARMHLSVLLVIVLALVSWDFILQRHGLLYHHNHQPLFYGPGFVEMRVILPLIWLCMIMFLATSISLIWVVHHQSTKSVVTSLVCIVIFALMLFFRSTSFLPNLVQKYIVNPNEISQERPFISNSIQATLAAYGLDKVEERKFTIKPYRLAKSGTEEMKKSIRNIPVWNREPLRDVFYQVQAIRTYYDFPTVDVGRYTVDDEYHQVYLSARELNLSKLPVDAGRSWINTHLQYTHGYGAVMIPADQGGKEFMDWFLREIPPETAYENLKVKEGGIYYGLVNYPYVLVPNDSREIDYPREDQNVLTDYKGSGGVSVSGILSKLFFAVYFGDRDVFFTVKTNDDSKVLFRRNIRQRIQKLTPFLKLDGDPYLVVADGKFYWIQDAYTVSDWYPYSELHPEGVNYIRNSIKITVDAYDGTVDYYNADPNDPIVRALDRIYPTLIKDLNEMPEDLRCHIRYPKDIFQIQMDIYLKYHQKDPELFYRNEDMWEYSTFERKKEILPLKANYLTLNLIDSKQHEFLLLRPFSPKNRANLRALAVVGCDYCLGSYGRIIMYRFSKGKQVYGPAQISALIEQDTEISQKFTLWDQIGSEIQRGKMIILPINNVVYYIQPVYLRAARHLKIPELKKTIVSQGDVVVMDTTLERAFERLKQKIEQRLKRLEIPETKVSIKEPN